ncbi:MAG: outer membrane protein transport protein [Parvularculaceae bacterium]|nr:outer membrane protein transport protein [Parvularculaceae bacterium]
MHLIKKASAISTMAIIGASFTISDALATEGYFQHGYGARHKALGGAGVADTRDATALSINPAGLVDADPGLTASISLFSPDRGFTGSGGPGFTPSGEVEGNDTSFFYVPNIAYSTRIGENTAFGITMYGNGGMNTDYEDTANPACMMGGVPALDGVFCGGNTGVNLNQAFISFGLAQDFGNFSVGVAPVIAIQMFEAKGLALFGAFSSDPANITSGEVDWAFGGGVRVGVDFDVTENIRVGASYQSKVWMGKFDKYAGLFADGGDFDVPQSLQAGVAADISPNFTVMFDYRWINYEGVNSVSNSTSAMMPLGAVGGPGFGWENVSAFKVGMEYRSDQDWTARLGYAHNNNPVGPEDVTLNILAPGIVTDHITAGFEKRINDRHAIEIGGMYAPTQSVSGIEVTPLGPNPGHTIELEMNQWEFTVGWKMYFGQ